MFLSFKIAFILCSPFANSSNIELKVSGVNFITFIDIKLFTIDNYYNCGIDNLIVVMLIYIITFKQMEGKYMTKKDYIKFADLLTSWKLKGYLNQVGVFGNVMNDLSSLFKNDNARFQDTKFINYIAVKIEKASKE